LSRDKESKTQIGTICGHCSYDQENKQSNMIKHIISIHKEVVSYSELGSKYINDKIHNWNFVKKHGVEPSNNSQPKTTTTKIKQLRYGDPITINAFPSLRNGIRIRN
jgi:hypothetical protein